MKAVAVLGIIALTAGCGGGSSKHTDVARTCSGLTSSLRALPVHESPDRVALTLRRVTEAFGAATDALPKHVDKNVDSFTAAVRRVNLVGAQLIQGNRQPAPGSGAELNRIAAAATSQLGGAARRLGEPACLPVARLTRERLKVPELL